MYEFPEDRPGVPFDTKIDFGIDVLPYIQLVSILPYRMTPAELKGQLKICSRRDLLG